MYIDIKQDESYTPNKIAIKAGTGLHDLQVRRGAQSRQAGAAAGARRSPLPASAAAHPGCTPPPPSSSSTAPTSASRRARCRPSARCCTLGQPGTAGAGVPLPTPPPCPASLAAVQEVRVLDLDNPAGWQVADMRARDTGGTPPAAASAAAWGAAAGSACVAAAAAAVGSAPLAPDRRLAARAAPAPAAHRAPPRRPPAATQARRSAPSAWSWASCPTTRTGATPTSGWCTSTARARTRCASCWACRWRAAPQSSRRTPPSDDGGFCWWAGWSGLQGGWVSGMGWPGMGWPRQEERQRQRVQQEQQVRPEQEEQQEQREQREQPLRRLPPASCTIEAGGRLHQLVRGRARSRYREAPALLQDQAAVQ